MPSFDTVLEPNLVEVKNAVDQTAKEIGTRFDFKGTGAKIEIKDKEITLYGDSDFQLDQVKDILTAKLTKRSVDARFMDYTREGREDRRRQGQAEGAGQGRHRGRRKQEDPAADQAAASSRCTAAIQGDAVRVTGAKRDDLQAAMALIRKDIDDLPLSFNNFRD